MLTSADLPAKLPEFGDVSTSFFVGDVRYFLLGALGGSWTIKRGSLADEVGQIIRRGDHWALAIYERDLVVSGSDWRELLVEHL